jgi:AAA+ superfamily predicted ATPase
MGRKSKEQLRFEEEAAAKKGGIVRDWISRDDPIVISESTSSASQAAKASPSPFPSSDNVAPGFSPQIPSIQNHTGTVNGTGTGTGGDVVDAAPFSIVLYRHYNPPKDKNDEMSPNARRMNQYAEAVLHKVLTMDNVPSLMMAMNGEWILHKEGKRLKMANDIYLTITKNDRTAWDVNALELTLTSTKRSANQLVRYVTELHEEHVKHVNNALGGNVYFFDHKEFEDFRGNPLEGTLAQKRFDIRNAPKHLSFQQLPFHSNKTFENLCGPEIELIAKRVNFFVNKREWYDQKGIPWQLGFLFSGASGSGKSSCIRAMANLTKRHIVNINFANIKTVTQLKKLFYSEELNVIRDDESRESVRLKVPIDKRIYVMEEIDALGKTIIERQTMEEGGETCAKAMQDEIMLGDVLQVLDGNMETPGRILVVTSNRPELLDEALIRPGRIDMNVRFGLASRYTIAQMYEKLHEQPLTKGQIIEIPHEQISPADAMEVMFRNFGTKSSEMANTVVSELKKRAAVANHSREERQDQLRSHVADLARIRYSSSSGPDTTRTEPVPQQQQNLPLQPQGASTSSAFDSFEQCANEGEMTFEAYVAACQDEASLERTRGGNSS